MKNFMEGAFVPQPGENIKDDKIVNARIKAENKEIGIHEISQDTIDEITAMDDEQFEAFIEWAVDEREKCREKASN